MKLIEAVAASRVTQFVRHHNNYISIYCLYYIHIYMHISSK